MTKNRENLTNNREILIKNRSVIRAKNRKNKSQRNMGKNIFHDRFSRFKKKIMTFSPSQIRDVLFLAYYQYHVLSLSKYFRVSSQLLDFVDFYAILHRFLRGSFRRFNREILTKNREILTKNRSVIRAKNRNN